MTSVCSYMCGQIDASDFGWSSFFFTILMSVVHQMADELFHRYGVSTADNANELVKEEIACQCHTTRCNIDTTDPHSPWQDRAENEIRENKRLTGWWKSRWAHYNVYGASMLSELSWFIHMQHGDLQAWTGSAWNYDERWNCSYFKPLQIWLGVLPWWNCLIGTK